MPARFTTITLAPALDRTVRLNASLFASPICRVSEETVVAGGKGLNVAKMLSRFGCPVAASGLLGDANCEPFERMLHNYSIENRFVRVHGETRRNLMLLSPEGIERKINFPAFPDLEYADYLLRQIALLAVKRADVVILTEEAAALAVAAGAAAVELPASQVSPRSRPHPRPRPIRRRHKRLPQLCLTQPRNPATL